MKTELCLIICFITGVLIFYLLKQSCGCGAMEGNGGSGTGTVQDDDDGDTLTDCSSTPNIVLEDGHVYDYNNTSEWYPNLEIQSSDDVDQLVACLKAQCGNKEGYNFYQYNDTWVNSNGIEKGILTGTGALRGTDGRYIACRPASGWVNDSEGDDTTPTMEVCVADMTKFDWGPTWNPHGNPPTFGNFDPLYNSLLNDDGTNLLDRYNDVQGISGPQGHADHWCSQMYTKNEHCRSDLCKLDTVTVGGG